MTKIIANMIGRNEESHYLDQVLTRLKDQVDVITFTDDCSDDNTAKIAESHGAKVMVMPQPTFNTHEGRLRQASWDHLERTIGNDHDWMVLAIDCDEELYETEHELSYFANGPYDVVDITFFHMWNEHFFRIDKAWAPHGSTRLFRYFPGGRFADRALACGSEPTYVPEMVRQFGNLRVLRFNYGTQQPTTDGTLAFDFQPSGLLMKHLSYIKDEDKKAKYERYASIDGGLYHANAHIESILDPNPELREWPWQ